MNTVQRGSAWRARWPNVGRGAWTYEDAVFVLGDNRDDAADGRTVGAIPFERVCGRRSGAH